MWQQGHHAAARIFKRLAEPDDFIGNNSKPDYSLRLDVNDTTTPPTTDLLFHNLDYLMTIDLARIPTSSNNEEKPTIH